MLIGTCQQTWKTKRWSAETGRVGTQPSFQERSCPGAQRPQRLALLSCAGSAMPEVMPSRELDWQDAQAGFRKEEALEI